MWFVLACAPPVEPSAPPDFTFARGVQAQVGDIQEGGWLVAAGTVLLSGGTARAADVTLSGGPVPLEIRAARSEWDLKGRKASFTGDVHITRADMQITCGLLEVFYKDVDHIDHAVATGGVEVTGSGRHATAERAEIHGQSGRIDLTGSPALSEGPNRLVGDHLTLFLDDERAICEGAAGAPCRLLVDGSALK